MHGNGLCTGDVVSFVHGNGLSNHSLHECVKQVREELVV